MVPAPPLRILGSKNDSLPTNTSKVRAARAVGALHDESATGWAVSANASRKVDGTSADIEFASLLVPNTASPQFCESNHWQCLMNRLQSGERSALNGVTTGASTPRMR